MNLKIMALYADFSMLSYKLDDPAIYPNRKQIKAELETGKLGDDTAWLDYIAKGNTGKKARK